jgi:hypothetical protein
MEFGADMDLTKLPDQIVADYLAIKDRATRRRVYPLLSKQLQERIRPPIEARRGIKRVDGKIVLTAEAKERLIKRLEFKREDCARRIANINDRLEELNA